MRFEIHCARCKEVLGEEWPEVHQWLDALANKRSRKKNAWMKDSAIHVGPINPGHRKFRHNWKGIAYIEKRWGPKAAEAAILHIMDDLFLKTKEEIPKDEIDYVRKGWCD